MIFTSNNITTTYSNLTIYPAADFNYGPVISDNSKDVTNEELYTNELITHIVTFAILFFMSTNVVYRIAQRKSDNQIEVII